MTSPRENAESTEADANEEEEVQPAADLELNPVENDGENQPSQEHEIKINKDFFH